MNENITPSDALVQQTIAKMESGRPHRARKPLKIILAVAAALACVSTAVAANQEAVLRVLYQIAPGMAEYLQPVGQVCEDQGVKLEVVSADVEGSTAKVYLSLTDTTGSLFGDAAPDLYDSWHLDYPRWGRAAPLSCGCSTVDYDPSTHTATYFLQIDDLGGDIPAGAFEFSFNKLLIGKVEQEGIPVTADLSAVPKNAPTENHEINGLSASDISMYEDVHDYDFLVPQGTLWQSEDGFSGFLSDRDHIPSGLLPDPWKSPAHPQEIPAGSHIFAFLYEKHHHSPFPCKSCPVSHLSLIHI